MNNCLNDINHGINGCDCPRTDFDCVYLCAFFELPFKFPGKYDATNFKNYFFSLANHFGNDGQVVIFAEQAKHPYNFDIPNKLVLLNTATNPCDFCGIPSGNYVYELIGQTNDPNSVNVVIQQGSICFVESLASKIFPCPEEA